MRYSEALNRIYNNLKAGKGYYTYIEYVRYPYYHCNLFYNGKYFCWNHAGSSANAATKRELLWIIETIFGTTPEIFEKQYILMET